MPERTIRDALKRAQKDPAFAVDLVQNPDRYVKEFNLSQPQVAALKRGKRIMTDAVKIGVGVPEIAGKSPYS